jgi:hypothetical protein
VTEDTFFSDLVLLADIESGLAFGSTRFGVQGPVTGIPEQIMFEQRLACTTFQAWQSSSDWYPKYPGYTFDSCATFGNHAPFGTGVVDKGLHAGMLEFYNTARQAYAWINATILVEDDSKKSNIPGAIDFKLCTSGNYSQMVPATLATGAVKFCQSQISNAVPMSLVNPTVSTVFSTTLTVGSLYPKPADPTNYSQVMGYTPYVSAAFNMAQMDWLSNASQQYLAPSLELAGSQYATYADQLYSGVLLTRILLLIIFIVLCFLLYVFFYSPMLWGLDAEEKQTSAMLLMIPVDFMDKIPSIKEFVNSLDVKI